MLSTEVTGAYLRRVQGKFVLILVFADEHEAGQELTVKEYVNWRDQENLPVVSEEEDDA
jgi:hypothetical protein